MLIVIWVRNTLFSIFFRRFRYIICMSSLQRLLWGFFSANYKICFAKLADPIFISTTVFMYFDVAINLELLGIFVIERNAYFLDPSHSIDDEKWKFYDNLFWWEFRWIIYENKIECWGHNQNQPFIHVTFLCRNDITFLILRMLMCVMPVFPFVLLFPLMLSWY